VFFVVKMGFSFSNRGLGVFTSTIRSHARCPDGIVGLEAALLNELLCEHIAGGKEYLFASVN
jgi:hypothetical protein